MDSPASLDGVSVRCRSFESDDHSLISEWNRQLQIDEGAAAMELEAIETRLRRWLSGAFDVVIFESDSEAIGYALYRPTDPDQKEPGGIYLRQFFIARAHRRLGHGSAAIAVFLQEVVQSRRLVLDALSSNPAGQAFWRSLGMREYSVTFEFSAEASD